MTWLGGRMRRRVLSGTPPTLAAVHRSALAASSAALTSGGDAMRLSGNLFASGAQVEVDGTLYATSFLSTTLLGFVAPAHTKGVVSVRVKNPDGQFSGAQSLRYVIDPASLSPSGHWEQRGDVSDYSTADTDGAGPDVASLWEDRSGGSGNRNMVTTGSGWTSPTTSAPIDGVVPVRFGAAANDLTTAIAVPNFLTTTTFSIALLIKLDPTVGAFTLGSIAGQCLAYVGGYVAIRAGQTGGAGKASLYTESPTVGTYIESAPFPLGSWVLIIARFGAGTMKLRVDAVDATPVAAAAISAGWASNPVRTSHASNGTSIHDELLRMYATSAWSDSQCDDLRDYCNYYRNPSLGLS